MSNDFVFFPVIRQYFCRRSITHGSLVPRALHCSASIFVSGDFCGICPGAGILNAYDRIPENGSHVPRSALKILNYQLTIFNNFSIFQFSLDKTLVTR